MTTFILYTSKFKLRLFMKCVCIPERARQRKLKEEKMKDRKDLAKEENPLLQMCFVGAKCLCSCDLYRGSG
jgi:hypothetical protein